MNIKISYAALFVQSHYSILSSTIRIKQLIKEAKDLGLTAIAITDSHNLFGAMEFSLECKKANIKGIIGCRAKIEGNREILIYCKNKIGYENLSALLTDSYVTSKEDMPYVKWHLLLKKAEGLIVIITPSISAANAIDLETCANLLTNKIEWYFGIESDTTYHKDIANLSKRFQKNVVALSRACFIYKHEEIAHDAMLCIRDKRYVSESNREKSAPNLKLKSNDEMQTSFAKLEFAIQNTVQIADRCNFLLEPLKPQIPKFKTTSTQEEVLRETAISGLKKHIVDHKITDTQAYFERIEYELDLINNMGFAGYFLIVSDFIRFAKQNMIPVGPGRGSGSGSLVAWCIAITGIDPVKFGLYFERFLNPGRVSMPDFDIDFSPKGREMVIDYVRKKYGNHSVAGIITFGSLSSRAALKDVGRVLHVPYSKTDYLSKKIQTLFGKVDTLQETYEKDASFASEIEEDENLKQVFHIAKILEGANRHVSAHAAGIVIRNQPIYTICPLYKDKHSGILLTQFSMKPAETAGLVKFDFLGLTALDVIKETCDLLMTKHIGVNIETIPLDDVKTFNLMRTGNTKGIFQFETRGMTKLIKDLKADCIDDLIAIVALYRPGPMDNIPLFIRSKEGKENIKYKYPQIDIILANTYGVMIYQEQIIKIAQEVAGFSMADADLLRRAMGKKIPEEMATYRKQFIDGTVKLNGGTVEDAEEIFDQIARFANYGFNKAHAVAYAIIGYQQAYLKAHYLLEFISVSMTSEQYNIDKLTELITDAKHMNIKFAPPCVNKPLTRFESKDNEIQYPLSAIKNIGIPLAENLRKEIEMGGLFKSFDDFLNRTNLNKREIEYLAMSGALDVFDRNRGQMFAMKRNQTKHSFSLFDTDDIMNETNNWSAEEYLKFQKDALGAYIGKHPCDQYNIKRLKLTYIQDLLHISQLSMIIIHKIVKKIDRNKKIYGICTISDPSGFYEAIIPNEDNLFDIQLETMIIAEARNANDRIIIENIKKIKEYIENIKKIHVKINTEQELIRLRAIIERTPQNGSSCEVFVHTDEVVHIASLHKSHIDNLLKSLENDGYQWTIHI